MNNGTRKTSTKGSDAGRNDELYRYGRNAVQQRAMEEKIACLVPPGYPVAPDK
jgi:hypothetical protein